MCPPQRDITSPCATISLPAAILTDTSRLSRIAASPMTPKEYGLLRPVQRAPGIIGDSD